MPDVVPPISEVGLMVDDGACVGVVAIVVVVVTNVLATDLVVVVTTVLATDLVVTDVLATDLVVTVVPAKGAADTDPKDSREAMARRAVGFSILKGALWREDWSKTLLQRAVFKHIVHYTEDREQSEGDNNLSRTKSAVNLTSRPRSETEPETLRHRYPGVLLFSAPLRYRDMITEPNCKI